MIAIENQNLTIATASLPAGMAGSPYNTTLTASGGAAPYTFTWTATSLPAWLALAPSSGVLSGTPTTAGTFTFAVSVTDATAHLTASRQFTLTVGTIVFTTQPALPTAVANSAYSTTVAVSGGASPYSWSASAGTLPAGLSLSSSTTSQVTISGTPTTAGGAFFTLKATDSGGRNVSQVFTMGVFGITTTAASQTWYSASSYELPLSTTGGVGQTQWSVTSGTLPPGTTLSSSAATIFGVPTTNGTYPFTVTATDSGTPSVSTSVAITIIVKPGVHITTQSALPGGKLGVGYSVTLQAADGAIPYTWTGSGLPAGLTLSSAGTISGSPSASGPFSFDVWVTDSSAPPVQGHQIFTITIAQALTIITDSPLPDATAGQAYYGLLQASGGTPPYIWSSLGGDWPAGLQIAQNGTIAGTPTNISTPGTVAYAFTVQVQDSAGITASRTYTMRVTTPSSGISLHYNGIPSPGSSAVSVSAVQAGNGSIPVSASWSLTGQNVGLYGAGTLSPMSNVSTTYYTAPQAVNAGQIATVTAFASPYTANIALLLFAPPPTVTMSGTTLSSGSNVSVNAGNATSFTMTSSQGDNWGSTNDYLTLWFSPTNCGVNYQPATHTVFLQTDSNTWVSGTLTSGSSQTLSNSQCMVSLNGSATTSGPNVTISLPITFNSNLTGQSLTVQALPSPATIAAPFWFGTVNVVAGNISLSPTSSSLGGTQTQQFTATVTGQSNNSVNWSLNPPLGTISASGFYTAPPTTSTAQTVTLTATSQANSSLSAWATVNLTTGTPYDLNLPNMTVLSGTNSFAATHNVNALNGFTIGGSASVTFQAGNSIDLGPGFHATAGTAGTTFHAIIQ